jgi:Fe2+ or Zn2+ uptake regulation protein
MKRVRDTSAQSLRELESTLPRREQIVLDALRHWRGCPPTSYELTKWLQEEGRAFDLNAVRPRLSALCDKGLVTTGNKRTCRVTGKTSYTWLLAKLPRPEPQQLELMEDTCH